MADSFENIAKMIEAGGADREAAKGLISAAIAGEAAAKRELVVAEKEKQLLQETVDLLKSVINNAFQNRTNPERLYSILKNAGVK